MKGKNSRPVSLHEADREDPIKADRELWGRQADPVTRRGFLHKAGLLSLSAAVGMHIPMARYMPAGLIPAAFAAEGAPDILPGKDGLIILNNRPLSAETPAHLLDDSVTPNNRMFVRNNGVPPLNVNAGTWRLQVEGESCERPASFSIADLRSLFETVTLQLQLESGANGRSEFVPMVGGNQWTTGAVGCPEFTGVRLRDVLNHCGVRNNARYVGYYGADTHLNGDPDRTPISRGVPLSKAMEAETLIAFEMNGEDIPLLNGYPLRLVCAGWPGAVSGKWLNRLVVYRREHEDEQMAPSLYGIPEKPVPPGVTVPEREMRLIESMPVKSIITHPQSGVRHRHGRWERLTVRGHAWAGDNEVSAVFISADFGVTWMPVALNPPANRLAWQDWQTWLQFPETGYYELWIRATDDQDRSQPMVVPGWNPGGYLNNACHRVAVNVV